MDSPGHRTNILRPYHRKVNLGLAWDLFNFHAVQQFERDYVEYTTVPVLRDGELWMEGRTKNGADLHQGDHFRVVIYYLPPPRTLTQGQIARIYGSCNGRKVAHLSYRSTGTLETSWETCLLPHDVPAHLPGPSSSHEAHVLWEEARAKWESRDKRETGTSRKIKMSEYRLDGDRFFIRADLSEVLDEHGPGVYQVVLSTAWWQCQASSSTPLRYQPASGSCHVQAASTVTGETKFCSSTPASSVVWWTAPTGN